MQLPLFDKVTKPTPWIAALVVVGVVGTGVTTAIALRSSEPAQQESIQKLTVPVKPESITVRIQASGEVQPVRRVNLSPKTQGRLAELYVEQGDRVEKGEVVARMEVGELEGQLMQARARLQRQQANLEKLRTGSRPEEIDRARARLRKAEASLAELEAGSRWEEIAEAEAAVDQARANLQEARSRLELAETQVRRNRTLRAEGAISQDDLDRALDERNRAAASLSRFEAALAEAQRRLERTRNGPRSQDIDQARADVDEARSQLQELLNGSRTEDIAMAEADVAEAEGQVRYYEIQLEDTKVRAPFAGVVSQRYADPGSFVTPATSASSASSATSTSILSLAQGLEVLAEVPEADISQIEAGQEVEIVADAYPDEVFKGQVKLIAPEAVEEQNVTLFQVRLDVETGLDKLRSGMTVDLTFLGDRLENALVVPTVAIVTKQGETGVLVPDSDGAPEFQAVTIGPSVGNKIQILDGVEAGDRVFVGLPEGQELDDIIGK